MFSALTIAYASLGTAAALVVAGLILYHFYRSARKDLAAAKAKLAEYQEAYEEVVSTTPRLHWVQNDNRDGFESFGYYHIKVDILADPSSQHLNGEHHLLFTKAQIDVARKRAEKNPEDLV